MALVVYRFLTRVPGVQTVPPAAEGAQSLAAEPAPAEPTPVAAEPVAPAHGAVPEAAVEAPAADGPAGEVAVAEPDGPEEGAATAAMSPVDALARAWARHAESAPGEGEDAVEPLSEEDELGDPEDEAAADPDERIEALRRKLQEARETSAAEPPVDERRRSVHDAGRSAVEAMRRAAGRPARPAPEPPAGEPGPGGPGPA